MAHFPSEKSVGDLLAMGVDISIEQEGLLEAPDGRPALAVWCLADPILESGQPWAINGMPVVVPGPLNCCTGNEPIASSRGSKPTTLKDVLHNEPFDLPTAVGESEFTWDYPWMLYMSEIIEDDHLTRVPWDMEPLDSTAMGNLYRDTTLRAMERSGYFELIDYFNWENGNDEPSSIEHEEHVFGVVLDSNGELRDPNEWAVDLVLPREEKYLWDKLQASSQHGWTSYVMALDPKERRSPLAYGGIPWF